MLYAQIPPHLAVKTKERSRNEPVERAEEPLPVDDSVVRHANKQIDALLEMEAHYRRQTELNLEAHYRRQTELNLEAQRYPRAESSQWGTDITDVRLRW